MLLIQLIQFHLCTDFLGQFFLDLTNIFQFSIQLIDILIDEMVLFLMLQEDVGYFLDILDATFFFDVLEASPDSHHVFLIAFDNLHPLYVGVDELS